MAQLDPTKPLWLPEGSVRALLALGSLVGFAVGVMPIEITAPIMAYYFGARTASK